MSKVYLVSSGSYDDYFIDAVFLDKAKAMQYCADGNHAWFSGKKPYLDANRIEERELNDDDVTIKEKTGYILTYQCQKYNDSYYDVSIGFESDVEHANRKHKQYSYYFIYTDDYNEAVRIARQMVEEFDKQAGALE